MIRKHATLRLVYIVSSTLAIPFRILNILPHLSKKKKGGGYVLQNFVDMFTFLKQAINFNIVKEHFSFYCEAFLIERNDKAFFFFFKPNFFCKSVSTSFFCI